METSGTHNAPCVVFVASVNISTPTATAVGYNVSTRRLVFTVATHGLLQNTAYVFKIANVLTPSSMVDAGHVVATTLDARDRRVDTTSVMPTDAIVAGGLGLASFATATDTPGFESIATVTFRTAGRVEMGGKVELMMPSEPDAQYGWRFTDGAPLSSVETSGTYNAPGVVFAA